MKNFIKFGLVGLAGYFVGFYEMKYKTLKILTNRMIKELEEKNSEKEGEKEEKLVELVDSYLSSITMTLQTSGSVENRIACLTILQTLFSQPSLYPCNLHY